MTPSDRLKPTELWQRTQGLRKALAQISGGTGKAEVVQLKHFIGSQRDLVRAALEGTWL